MLRERRTDVNARDSYGDTPIFWLARRGTSSSHEAQERAAARALVAAGARASRVFDDGDTPLIMAAWHKHTRIARVLIEEVEAPVNERNPKNGTTALHVSCQEEDATTAALLLEKGADAEARGELGRTPLFESILSLKTSMTELLLDRGASVNVIDTESYTPLLWACADARWFRDERWPVFEQLLRRSSVMARCAIRRSDGGSAIDHLAKRLAAGNEPIVTGSAPPSEDEFARMQERRRGVIAELLASGAPVLPANAAVVLPIAASLGARQEAELAARRSAFRRWRAHDDLVGLALDMRELREAERAVEENERRVEALKQELRELGAGSGTDESEDEDDNEGGSDWETVGASEISSSDSESSSDGEGEDEPSSYQADVDFARLYLATQGRRR
jgi:hypothetical protein